MSRHRAPNRFTLRDTAVVAAGTAAAVLALAALASIGEDARAHRAEHLSAPSVHIEEDEPGWDCRTMGNLTCGPETFTLNLGSSVFTFPAV